MSKETPAKGLTRLRDLDAAEISLVPRGANRRKFLFTKSSKKAEEEVEKAVLTTEGRKHIKESNFAIPETRSYPIQDLAHAKNALARSGGKAEEAKVRAAVYRKYPQLKPEVKKSVVDMIAKADPAVMDKVHQALQAHNKRVAVRPALASPATGFDDEQNPLLAPTEPGEVPDIEKGDEPFVTAVPPQHVGKGDEDFTPAGSPTPVSSTNVSMSGADPTEMPLDEQAQAAVKAVVRILLPFKEKVSPLLLHEVLEAAGFQLTGDDEDEGEEAEEMEKTAGIEGEDKVGKAFQAIPARVEAEDEDVFEGDVKKGHFHDAVAKANACYKEHMEKAGYKAYPAAEMAKKHDGSSVEKSKGEPVSKSGSAPDLSRVDPKTARIVEDLYAANKEAVKKNGELQKSIDELKAENRRKEIVAKASAFTHLGLPQEDVVATLVDADKAGKTVYERVEKNFSTLNEQAKASGLFSEVGSSHAGGSSGGQGGADNAYAQIEKLADGLVQKSSVTLTKSQAIDMVLQSPEGKKLYGQHQAARGGI